MPCAIVKVGVIPTRLEPVVSIIGIRNNGVSQEAAVPAATLTFDA
jgi:hypothetical protein